jgi:hypothetical protein
VPEEHVAQQDAARPHVGLDGAVRVRRVEGRLEHLRRHVGGRAGERLEAAEAARRGFTVPLARAAKVGQLEARRVLCVERVVVLVGLRD